MVNQRYIPDYASPPPLEKIKNTPLVGLGIFQEEEKPGFIRYDEMTMPTPELFGDDTASLQSIDSPRSFIALDIPDEEERPAKRRRVDSLLSPVSDAVAEEEEEGEEVVLAQQSSEEKSEDSSFIGIHQEWTIEEEQVSYHIVSPLSVPYLNRNQTINRSYNYLISHSGKDIRKQVLAAFDIWLNIDAASFDIINRVVGMLHNASLL
jgi:hypothetical protein